ncbi:Protein CBG27303 [Caenorhabditis briggsae]|uniref:Protein CBG27303 n=2 Tax=Caenorhabditis briggsae TaxID=6238 RepID=B6IM80_CAEBR|nr:Protein CBG27303 [Caenorhabditis briggsae]ULT92054.1 hypothetical protein L3Y34_009634 [Caenorhabditis briggsae]CAS01010.1 Protein CBG27303 [Caenorhabditis briggsae]
MRSILVLIPLLCALCVAQEDEGAKFLDATVDDISTFNRTDCVLFFLAKKQDGREIVMPIEHRPEQYKNWNGRYICLPEQHSHDTFLYIIIVILVILIVTGIIGFFCRENKDRVRSFTHELIPRDWENLGVVRFFRTGSNNQEQRVEIHPPAEEARLQDEPQV